MHTLIGLRNSSSVSFFKTKWRKHKKSNTSKAEEKGLEQSYFDSRFATTDGTLAATQYKIEKLKFSKANCETKNFW